MEARTVTLDSTFDTGAYTSVTFNQPFTSVPVVFVMATTDGGDSAMTRIRNVTTTGFEVAAVEPESEDGPHVGMTVHYFAIEPGTNTLPSGHQITAGMFSYNGQSFNNTGPGGGLDRNDSTTLTTPGVTGAATFVQLQTMNNSPAHAPSGELQPWMGAVVTSQADDEFNVTIDRSEDYDSTSGPNFRVDAISNESLGYLYLPSDVQGSFISTSNTSILYETQNTSSKFVGYSNGCTTHNFSGTYSAPPLVIASKVTRNEADGGWFRRCSLSNTSVGLLVDEDQRQDSERSHIAEAASLLVFSSDFSYDSEYVPPTPANDLVVEAGRVTVNSVGNWQTVEFNQSYESTPAVFVLTDNANPDPQAFRIRNVTQDSFEVIALEPPGANNATLPDMEVHYVVFPVGQFEFPNNGPKLEVNILSMTNFQSKSVSGSSYLNLPFSRTDFSSAPSVLVQVQSKVNGSSTSNTPWLTGFANNVTSTGAQISMDRAEVQGGSVSSEEQVAYLAIENGIIPDFKDLSGNVISGEVLRSSDSVTHDCTSIGFQQSYSGPPLVVGNKQTRDGADGGWTRRCSVSNSDVQLKIDEDTDSDNDRSHTTEVVSFIAFSDSFVADFSNRAYYKLDETVWNGSANEVQNSANTSGLHGQAIGGASSTPARVCYGANLDGSPAYLSIPDDDSLDISDELTVTAWIHPNSYGSELKSIVSKDENFEFHLNSSGRINWWWGGGNRELTGNDLIPLNQWTHVAIVYSQSQPYQAIYVNGTLDVAKTEDLGALTLNSDTLQIGADDQSGSTQPQRYWDGLIDEVRIYSRAISEAGIQDIMDYTHPCVSALDHLEISAVEEGNTCSNLAVTITACADSSSPCNSTSRLLDYAETVSLQVIDNSGAAISRGSWFVGSGKGTLTDPTADDGAANYQFHINDQGQAVVELSYIYADQIKLRVSDSVNNRTADSDDISFSDNAFLIQWTDPIDADPSDNLPTVAVAGRAHQATISYVRRDRDTADPMDQCGVVTDYEGSKDLYAWYTDRGAFSSPLPPAPSVSASSTVLLPSSKPGTVNFTGVNFTSGVASVSLGTTDVGKFSISVSDESGYVSSLDGSVVEVTGTSSDAIVRPFGLTMDLHDASVTPTCSTSGSRNTALTGVSYAAGPSDSAYKKAGESFHLTVRSVLWESVDDNAENSGLGDGVPDSGSDLYDNACTNSFGQENTAETVTTSISNFLPVAGVQGELLGEVAGNLVFSGFSAGVSTNTTNYDEVGIFSLSGALTSGSYLGSGINLPVSLLNVGRFIPNHFTVSHSPTPPVLDDATGWACDFTYQSQDFQLESDIVLSLTAHEVGGDITENYGGEGTAEDYFKLAALDPQSATNVTVANNVTNRNPTLAFDPSISSALITEADDYDGDAVITFSGFLFSYQREDNQVGSSDALLFGDAGDMPFEANLDWILDKGQLTDLDGACLNNPSLCEDYTIANLTGTEIRYGRAWIGNNSGSELVPLELVLRTEYWSEVSAANNRYAFVVNTDDSCSDDVWSDTDLSLDQYTGKLNPGSPGDVSASLGVFDQGQGIIRLNKPTQPNQGPGQGNEGSVNVTLDVEDWLKYDFLIQTPTNIPNENPVGTGTFGIFSGREPVFYLRESYR
ncbi:DUF6701 domain-containing protein [Litoribrevibacter euphylliae]|uniref:DUF6701 domain-containing protein n=1 Tax=Litoribrevibacter euphylliae TaxID=1834034 RepID=A0ABV7HHT6_9GAMM